ncbi:hypothetical protein NTGM5_600001 [Candidatus Nitrotoga sp. M5]|nr:hypothetical protein NTGM5_600001 [Candidatus Nitrotoga sp. M5]
MFNFRNVVHYDLPLFEINYLCNIMLRLTKRIVDAYYLFGLSLSFTVV